MLHPLVAVWMLIAIVLILALRRKMAIVPYLLAFFTIPIAQVILVGSLHFPVLRILILTVLARMIVRGGGNSGRRLPGGFNRLDTVVILWTVWTLIANSLQWMDLQAFIKIAGDFIDALGSYLAARYLIPDRQTVRRAISVLALVCVIQGACMITEQFTHHNVFAALGANEPDFRGGHVRAEGSIGNLWAGAIAGASIPLFLGLWTEKKSRMAALAGIAGATAMVLASHASTSWGTYGAALLGLCFWPLRKQMRIVRYGIVAALVGLHLVMHGPVLVSH